MSTKLVISDMTEDFDQWVSQLETHAQVKDAWRGNYTSNTSQTLIEFVAAIGTYVQGSIRRVAEDAFQSTAQSEEAIRANAHNQGVRISRKLPAQVEVELVSPITTGIPALTQFSGALKLFNREAFNIEANVPKTVTLYQGDVVRYRTNGLGSELQSFTSPEGNFTVSDRDVEVRINDIIINKAYDGALWNYRNQDAYADLTVDGRLLVQFGRNMFGSVPNQTDQIDIIYPITDGASSNGLSIIGRNVSVSGYTQITGIIKTNPSGGSNERSAVAYKNVVAGAFGTYDSATTGKQYISTVSRYPGIVDSVTQSQRDINKMNKDWMNVIRVSALTSSPWSPEQKDKFCRDMEAVSMFSPYFLWQDPVAIPRDLDIALFCYNTANLSQVRQDVTKALEDFFSPRAGLLTTDFFESDISQVVRIASKGQMAYIEDYSSYPMLASMPNSPRTRWSVTAGTGTLQPSVYAYAVSVALENGDEGAPTDWVFPQVTEPNSLVTIAWDRIGTATSYKLWGRVGDRLGLIAELPASQTQFNDDGTITPTGTIPVNSEFPIRYNTLNSLKLSVSVARRQTRVV